MCASMPPPRELRGQRPVGEPELVDDGAGGPGRRRTESCFLRPAALRLRDHPGPAGPAGWRDLHRVAEAVRARGGGQHPLGRGWASSAGLRPVLVAARARTGARARTSGQAGTSGQRGVHRGRAPSAGPTAACRRSCRRTATRSAPWRTGRAGRPPPTAPPSRARSAPRARPAPRNRGDQGAAQARGSGAGGATQIARPLRREHPQPAGGPAPCTTRADRAEVQRPGAGSSNQARRRQPLAVRGQDCRAPGRCTGRGTRLREVVLGHPGGGGRPRGWCRPGCPAGPDRGGPCPPARRGPPLH